MPDKSIWLIILYVIGLFGLMLAGNEFLRIDDGYFLMIAVGIVLMSVIFWFMYTRSKHFLLMLIVFFVAVMLMMLVSTGGGLNFGLLFSDGAAGIIYAFGLISFVAFFFFAFEFILRTHLLFLLGGIVLITFGPLFNLSISLHAMIMIVIFEIGFIVLNMTDRRHKKQLYSPHRAKINAVTTFLTAIVLLLAFIPSFIIEKVFEEDLYLQVYHADGYIQEGINWISGKLGTIFDDGMVSRGNLHQTGRLMLNVKTSDVQDKLYLRGFTGGDFYGDKWTSAFDDSENHQDSYMYTGSGSLGRELYIYDLINECYNNYVYASEMYVAVYDNSENNVSMTIPTLSDVAGYDANHLIYYKIGNDGYATFTMYNPTTGSYYDSLELGMPHPYFDIPETMRGFKWAKPAKKIDDNGYIYFIDEDGTYFYIDEGLAKFNDSPVELYDYDMSEENTYNRNSYTSGMNLNNYFSDSYPVSPDYFTDSNVQDIVNNVYSEIRQNDYGDPNQTTKKTNIIITPTENYNQKSLLMPYGSLVDRGYLGDTDEYSSGYFNMYYDISDLDMSQSWKKNNTYEMFIDAYQNYASIMYTHAETDERLVKLVNENPLDDPNEITTFILYTLQNHAVYSTTPGSAPLNKDIVGYFLFDNGKGYCVHFATAAAMMYRLYGIPARYVTGYSIPSSYFVNSDEDGGNNNLVWEARVDDYCAHAWVEIFLKDYGWVPVEVTPSIDGVMNASYPGYDQSKMMEIMNSHNWKFRSQTTDGQGGGQGGNGNGLFDNLLNIDATLFIFFVSVLILTVFAAFFVIRIIVIKKRQRNMSCRRAFDYIILMLSFSGRLKDYRGNEKDFVPRFIEAVPDLESEDISKVNDILLRDNYSQLPADSDETEFVREQSRKLSKTLYSGLNPIRKLLWKLWKVFP